jgi:dihydroflavonol-4-reductase
MNSGTLVKLAARAPVLPVPPGGGSVVDVDDVVSGILAAAQMGKPGERYALGSENLSFQAIFDAVCAAVGRNPPRVRLPRWTRMPAMAAAAAGGCLLRGRFLTPQIVGDMYRFKYCCGDRARRDLGWRPRFSFSESVGRAVDFYRREGLI